MTLEKFVSTKRTQSVEKQAYQALTELGGSGGLEVPKKF